jgi:hypothetical protein
VNAVMNLRVPYNSGKLPSGYTTNGLSSSAQVHRASHLADTERRKWLCSVSSGRPQE